MSVWKVVKIAVFMVGVYAILWYFGAVDWVIDAIVSILGKGHTS